MRRHAALSLSAGARPRATLQTVRYPRAPANCGQAPAAVPDWRWGHAVPCVKTKLLEAYSDYGPRDQHAVTVHGDSRLPPWALLWSMGPVVPAPGPVRIRAQAGSRCGAPA